MAYTDREELWTIDGDMVRWVGVVLFAAAGVLEIFSVFVLGERFREPGFSFGSRRSCHDVAYFASYCAHQC